MSLFNSMLKSDESIFKNPVALDFDYVPKLIPFRESEQFRIASCIKPLFQERNGRNLVITGSPGVGKTVACKHVIEELEDKSDEIHPIYINCWKFNTSYKVFLEVCRVLEYHFTQNKKTEDLFSVIKQLINKRSAVFIFDEIDKAEEHDFLYLLLEEIYRRSVILITNDKEWIVHLDLRIKSRLMAEMVEFRSYNETEVRGILEQRKDLAFYDDVWEKDAWDHLVKKAAELHDIRAGLYLMRESGNIAEDNSAKKITLLFYEETERKLDDFFVKDKQELGSDEKLIMELVKKHPGERIGELFKICQGDGLTTAYKSFQRKIKRLEESKFVSIEKIIGGSEGTTTIVTLRNIETRAKSDGDKPTKLTEF